VRDDGRGEGAQVLVPRGEQIEINEGRGVGPGGRGIYLDVTVVRVLYVSVSILSAAFPGIFVYVILMFVIPRADAAAP